MKGGGGGTLGHMRGGGGGGGTLGHMKGGGRYSGTYEGGEVLWDI